MSKTLSQMPAVDSRTKVAEYLKSIENTGPDGTGMFCAVPQCLFVLTFTVLKLSTVWEPVLQYGNPYATSLAYSR